MTPLIRETIAWTTTTGMDPTELQWFDISSLTACRARFRRCSTPSKAIASCTGRQINYCALRDLDMTRCLAGAYEQIKDRRCTLMPAGTRLNTPPLTMQVFRQERSMSTRPPEPEFLVQWRDWMRAGPPKCCHTCDHFNKSGHCLAFDMPPPDDFASTPDACDQWIQEIPF